MKCPYCGNEIANDSVFCEFCGKKVVGTKKLKPLWITLAMLLVLSVLGGGTYYLYVAIEQVRVEAAKALQEAKWQAEMHRQAELKAQGLVDLGLPSGTLWKDKNESGFYTYDDAVSSFGSKLPTKEQLEELINSCRWIWHGKGYKVVGPNGNSIFLPAEGLLRCNGSVKWVGSLGYYWSSAPDDSGRARDLYFNSGEVFMYKGNRCSGLSVRLVQ